MSEPHRHDWLESGKLRRCRTCNAWQLRSPTTRRWRKLTGAEAQTFGFLLVVDAFATFGAATGLLSKAKRR